MKIFITGIAGFIGYHLAKLLLTEGHEVVGIDSINDYYDTKLKKGRLHDLGLSTDEVSDGVEITSTLNPDVRFIKGQLEDTQLLEQLFDKENFDVVINLAAQAGVRYSLENPKAYISSNVDGFLNILENCRRSKIKNLIYASSSSVYGLNKKVPFSTTDNVDHPISLYAASKKSNELMAHSYSHLFNIPTTGIRFFTVYGPWGRPDMAAFIFTKAIYENKPINVFNKGEMFRDFTYVDDIVKGVYQTILKPATPNPTWKGTTPDPSSSTAPYRILNIGNSSPVKLLDFVKVLEREIGIKANINFQPMQPGDVETTFADTSDLELNYGYKPTTSIQEGVKKFIQWYKSFYLEGHDI